MKKGFTLIELLAVIVILAVIALIAVPIILNIVDDSKKSAARESAKIYVEGLSSQIASKAMINGGSPNLCLINSNGLLCDGKIMNYEIKGQRPTGGFISYTNGKIDEYALCIMDYKVSKTSSGTTVEKSSDCTSGEQIFPSEEIDVYDGESVSTSLAGCGIESDPYLIQSANDLVYMRNQVNNSDVITTTSTCDAEAESAATGYYKQTVGIALNDTTNWTSWDENTTGLYTWEPIGIADWDETLFIPFNGSYDGNNHSVSGIYSVSNGDTGVGMFGDASKLQLKNLRVIKSYLSGGTAGIVGVLEIGNENNAYIDNCYSNIRIENAGAAGGIVGNIDLGTSNIQLTNLYNQSAISINSENISDDYYYITAGGIVGEFNIQEPENIQIHNLTNTGSITCNLDENDDGDIECGGAFGSLSFNAPVGNISIHNMYNMGNITCNTPASYGGCAGIIGQIEDPEGILHISNLGNSGSVTCTGLSNCYGVAGGDTYSSFAKVYNTGTITSEHNTAGLFNSIGDLSESYNSGNIVGHDADGLVYYADSITNSYNTGNVTVTNSYPYGILQAFGVGDALSMSNVYNTGNISVSFTSDDSSSQAEIYAAGIGDHSETVSNVYNTGNVTVTTAGAPATFVIAGINVGLFGTMSNSYNTGIISTNLDTNNTYYGIGAIAGFYAQDAVFTNNKYLVGTASSASSGFNPLFCDYSCSAESYTYQGEGITAVSSINDMPSIISVVNGQGKFKADTKNINGGNPILSWQ